MSQAVAIIEIREKVQSKKGRTEHISRRSVYGYGEMFAEAELEAELAAKRYIARRKLSDNATYTVGPQGVTA